MNAHENQRFHVFGYIYIRKIYTVKAIITHPWRADAHQPEKNIDNISIRYINNPYVKIMQKPSKICTQKVKVKYNEKCDNSIKIYILTHFCPSPKTQTKEDKFSLPGASLVSSFSFILLLSMVW